MAKKGGTVILALLLCVMTLLGIRSAVQKETAEPASALAALQPQILLDPGHGGIDGGAVGVSGVLEKTLNLEVALRCEPLLAFLGIPTELTRRRDTDLAGETSGSVAHRKAEDIRARAALLDGNPSAILVSIHMNHYTDARYAGAQVFYSPGHSGSQRLGEEFQRLLILGLDVSNRRQAKVSTEGIYLLKTARRPAVLVECGFLSNPAEEQRLGTADYQKRLAVCIAAGAFGYTRFGA